MDPVLLILAGVAAFILFRLISVLGTRTGHEQRHDVEGFRTAQRQQENNAEMNDQVAEEKPAPKPVSTNARLLREADPAFDEGSFLDGAKGAYEMIVEAFAAGDLRSIRQFLDTSVFDAFKSAVVAREQADHKADLKFVGIDHAGIVDSDVKDGLMVATIEFVSNQIRVTRDRDDNVIDGDPNRIELVKDRWAFSRKVASNDPNWILVATGGAG